MVQNQAFDDGEPLEISSKHLKQVVEQSNQIVSFSESVFPEESLKYHHALGDEVPKNDTESDEKHSSGVFSEPNGSTDDFDISVPGCTSFSSGRNNRSSEEGTQSKSPLRYSISSEYFNPVHHQRRILTYCEEIYSLLLDHPPQKSVSIGPDYQANIPPWRSRDANITSDDLYTPGSVSKSDLTVDEYEQRLIGTCVIPMPDVESSISQEVGSGRADCSCEDSESVGCFSKHIAEGREELEKILGPERFSGLGLSEMGEQVAQKWSEEEERLFYEVVFSNPASLGKNFWGDLSIVFASKTKKEIVSYYFNVFMLRRRAEQNRCDSLNIDDSDNDEWHGTDDYGDNEPVMSEEDEDSVVESPLHEGGLGFSRGMEDDLQEYDRDIADETVDDNGSTGIGNCFNNHGSSPSTRLQNKFPCDESGGEHEVQDDSCTSSDTGIATQETSAKTEHCDQWLSSFTNNGVGLGHESGHEHCDAKVWDVGFLSCSKSEVDFLPTSSMIEEVFGNDSCNYKTRDGKKS